MELIIIGGGIGGLTLALAAHAATPAARIRVFEAAAGYPPARGRDQSRTACGEGAEPARAPGCAGGGRLPAAGLCLLHQPRPARLPRAVGPRGRASVAAFFHPPRRPASGSAWMRCATGSGRKNFITGHRCIGIEQSDARRYRALRRRRTALRWSRRQGDVLVACDGIHSAVRAQFYPDEGPFAYRGINMWRGVTRQKPYLTGRSIARIGARHSTLIIYPIRDNIDAAGNQLVNWVAEIERDVAVPVDWNKPGRLEDFYPVYQDWSFDWLDVPAMMRNADAIFSYPMVDRDPLARWTLRPRHAAGRCRPSHVSAGRQRRRAGDPRCRHAGAAARRASPTPRRRSRPMKPRGCRRPAASCCRTARRRRTSSSTRWSSAPAASASTSSKTSSARTSCRTIFERYQKVAGYHVQQVGRAQG